MNKGNITIIVSIVIVLALIGAGVYYFLTSKNDVAEEVMASVNGVNILKNEFDAQLATALATYTTQGIDTEDPANLLQIKTRVLDDLINNELVRQGIKESGITATEEEVEAEFQKVKEGAGGEEAFQANLKSASTTEEQLRLNIQNQLSTQKYVLANVDVASITVSDEELLDFYTKGKETQPDLPPFEEVESLVREQLLLNKQQELLNQFLLSLREKAEIEIKTLE